MRQPTLRVGEAQRLATRATMSGMCQRVGRLARMKTRARPKLSEARAGRRPATAAPAARSVPSPAAGRLARAGPVVADRPDQPQADQHRHQQAQHGDLVGAVAERVEQQEQDEAVQQLADDLRALADESVDPEELADLVRRRQADHQHAVRHLDPAQPRSEDRPGDEERARARPARTRSRPRRAPARPPTTRGPRRASSSGPAGPRSVPHTKLIAIATTVSSSRTRLAFCGDSPIVCTTTMLMTTMTVLTASE